MPRNIPDSLGPKVGLTTEDVGAQLESAMERPVSKSAAIHLPSVDLRHLGAFL